MAVVGTEPLLRPCTKPTRLAATADLNAEGSLSVSKGKPWPVGREERDESRHRHNGGCYPPYRTGRMAEFATARLAREVQGSFGNTRLPKPSCGRLALVTFAVTKARRAGGTK